MFYSIVIAVFKREDELRELLLSLSRQSIKSFEVLVVDDGSNPPLKPIAEEFKQRLNIRYFHKPNSGPADSRNFGMAQAKGDYFIFLDSDTLAPKQYLQCIDERLKTNFTDFFGGPDSSASDFNAWQKAINFSMTSLLTTGGIRGNKKSVNKFQPRSFNMGISRKAYEKSGGFGELRYGEDPDLSMGLWEHGFESQFIAEATVVHKRRSSAASFYRQVRNFGIARPVLNQRHPQFTKLSFWFPSAFLLALVAAILLACFGIYFGLACFVGYLLAIFVWSGIQNRSVLVGILSVWSTLIQFLGYGSGYLLSWIKLNLLKIPAKKAFPNHFRM